jgi:hypothetical protein
LFPIGSVRSTTKNAHTQEKREIFAKKDRFIYLIRYTALAQARLKAKCWVADDKVKPSNYGSLLTIVLLSGKTNLLVTAVTAVTA